MRRQLRRETIKQEPQAGKEKKEKTFIATDENGGMIGVVSAPSPEKAAAKTFHQKLAGQKGATREKPLEIRIRDLGASSDYHFNIWTELFEATENEIPEKGEGKKALRKLIIKKNQLKKGIILGFRLQTLPFFIPHFSLVFIPHFSLVFLFFC